MGLLFSGLDHHVVIFRGVRFWAERGLIHIEGTDGDYQSVSVRTMLRRMKAIAEMLGRRGARTDDRMDAAARREHQDWLDGMQQIVVRAKEHGMPTDASACRDLKRRRQQSVQVPSLRSSM